MFPEACSIVTFAICFESDNEYQGLHDLICLNRYDGTRVSEITARKGRGRLSQKGFWCAHVYSILAVAFLTCPIWTSPARAQSQNNTPSTTGEFYRQCSTPRNFERNPKPYDEYCIGVLNGVFSTLFLTNNVCPNGSVSNAAMLQVFKNWARNNPDRWSEAGYRGMTWAFLERWGCD